MTRFTDEPRVKPRCVYIEMDDGTLLCAKIRSLEQRWEGARANYSPSDFRYGEPREYGSMMQLYINATVPYVEAVERGLGEQAQLREAVTAGLSTRARQKAVEARERVKATVNKSASSRRFEDLEVDWEKKTDEDPDR